MAQGSVFEIIYKTEISKFGIEAGVIDGLWKEIQFNYSKKGRHYHTLDHLDSVVAELIQVKELIKDWQTLTISIAYHDFIYNPLRQDNEEKSADEAMNKLGSLNASQEQKSKCREQIITTKGQSISQDTHTNYFIDADLAILGSDPKTYENYSRSIRKEYKYYPDLIYKPGRRKVLKYFLEMERIFKTNYFFDKYEKQARINIDSELS